MNSTLRKSLRRSATNGAISIAVLVGGASLLSGCAMQPGSTVVSYDLAAHTVPPTITAEVPGKYSLYASDTPTPLYTAELQKNDEVGFVQRGDGSVVAVALGNDIALTSALAKTYYWKLDSAK